MKVKTRTLLRRIGDTEDASLRLTARDAKAAQELINDQLAVIIPHSGGGGDVALTEKGIQAYQDLCDPSN